MTTEEKMLIVMKYSDEILEVIEQSQEFSRGDLQARTEGIVLSILDAAERKN